MEVLILLMFVGIVMVALALTFFFFTVRAGSFQHADRLALLPLGQDARVATSAGTKVEMPLAGSTPETANGPVGRDVREGR
jgi:cbb3-type cytochrome oxidase maturation protein